MCEQGRVSSPFIVMVGYHEGSHAKGYLSGICKVGVILLEDRGRTIHVERKRVGYGGKGWLRKVASGILDFWREISCWKTNTSAAVSPPLQSPPSQCPLCELAYTPTSPMQLITTSLANTKQKRTFSIGGRSFL
eukprot:768717-Hanusia_phi.AAC.4